MIKNQGVGHSCRARVKLGAAMNITNSFTLIAACILGAAALLWAETETRFFSQAIAAGAPAPGEALSQSYRESQRENEAYQKIEPIKVFDNLYYVGPGYVSVWLITTSDGLILIDGAHASYGDHILGNIRKVGLDPADIEYILISHGHLDHFGGVARIQELSGARVVAVEEDWKMITAAADGPGRRGGPSPRVPARDMVVEEGDTLTLGDSTLIMHHTPGHTPGVLSFEFTVFDNGTPHRAYYSGGMGGRGGVPGFEAAVDSSEWILQLENIEVALTGHSWLGGGSYPNGAIFERAALLAQRGTNDPHPFVDAASWQQWINAGYERNLLGLEEARQEAATSE